MNTKCTIRFNMMRRAVLILGIVFWLCIGAARAESLSLVRDEEIERAISFYLTPLFEQAGLDPKAMEIHLVKDDTINAFAAKGLHVFIHTGLILKADNAQEIIAVLAHETGHISGGHIVRLYENMRIAQRNMLLSMILGAVAAAAGGGADVAVGAVLGGANTMQSAFAAYRRTEENAADQTAVSLLQKTGHDLSGLETIMRKLKAQESYQATDDFVLWRSHPAAKERLDIILNQQKTKFSPDQKRMKKENALFDRIKAKLTGFLYPTKKTLERYPKTDTGLPARYARAIAAYKDGLFKDALVQADSLIFDYPDDPYFYELKGQILFETGKAAQAVEPYQKAVSLLPDSALLRLGLIQAQIEKDDADALIEAEKSLSLFTNMSHEIPLIWRLQAVVYGRTGRQELASYALAEYNLALGNKKQAESFARRAAETLPEGMPAQLRAQDILHSLQDKKSKNNPKR
ncbi:MAG: M48 family metalloprotease [Alphaproteobacteria bacterium]|nr:M48 family metalloprotease [Alphaproteobacteria bacterium]